MSYIRRVFSPIKRLLINPDWVFEMRLCRTVHNLAARADEAILYTTDRSEIGLQFFRNCLGLSPFGRHEIIHCLREIDICPVL